MTLSERLTRDVQDIYYDYDKSEVREDVDAREAVEGALGLIGPALRKRSVEVDVRVHRCAVFAHVDRAQLLQALVNVLLNACHAAPERGAIVVDARETAEGTDIWVADSGPGIPDALREKVCEPFFSTKPEGQGTGLGLSITRGILESHGGSLIITRDAELGGARMTFRLPPPG